MELRFVIVGLMVIALACYTAWNIGESGQLISRYYKWIDENYSGPKWLRPAPIRPNVAQGKLLAWLLVLVLGALGTYFVINGVMDN
jgi:hypothetical protein